MSIKYAIVLLTIITLSCTTFHSRMFIKENPVEPVNGLIINPTIVAYQNIVDRHRDFDTENDYWIEISVSDTVTEFPKKLLNVSNDHRELASVRNKFRERVMKNFSIDTVTVILLPSNEQFRIVAVRDIPGWKWELKIRFGSLSIGHDVASMRLIVPYESYDPVSSQFAQDTIEFTMKRYEYHDKDIFAPDIPKSFEELKSENSGD